jgi:hypothetical protein
LACPGKQFLPLPLKIPRPALSLQNLWDELDLEAAENSAGTWQTFDLENRMKNSQAINDGGYLPSSSNFSLVFFIVNNWARIFKLLRSPGIDSKESIPPAYIAWRAGAITLFLLGS